MTTTKPSSAAREPTQDELSQYSTTEGLHWTDRPDGESTIRYAKRGLASKEQTPAITVIELLQLAAKKRPTSLALSQEAPHLVAAATSQSPPPALPMSEWRRWTWSEYHSDVRKTAKAMMKLGFAAHDAACVFGFNSPEWVIAALGAIFAGGKACGVYPTDTPEQFRFKCEHSRSSVVFVESIKHVQHIAPVLDKLPYVKAVVVWDDGSQQADLDALKLASSPVQQLLTWQSFMGLAENVNNEYLDERIQGIRASHACALVYTSGTTGDPKAVMISHDNIVFEARVVMHDGAPNIGGVSSSSTSTDHERFLSYLPLSHIAGFMIDIACPIVITAMQPGVCSLYFARAYDLKLGSLGDRLRAVKPTVFLGVPRVWEKMEEKLKQVGARLKPGSAKKRIATWAKGQALERARNAQLGGTGKAPSGHFLANKLVLKKIREAMGLGEVKFALSGAAPIAHETLQYFASLGINILNCFGLSEVCAATTWSTEQANAWGSVGYALGGMEVKIFELNGDAEKKKECPRAKHADVAQGRPTPQECHGELCVRGRHVMMGYMANAGMGDAHMAEVRKKNEEAIDGDGWFHSGDIAFMTDKGFVFIAGRQKELIITAGGENIAPVPIEEQIKKLGDGIVSNVQMIGDRRKFNSALFTLRCKGATGEKPGTDELEDSFTARFPSVKTVQQAAESSEVIAFLTSIVQQTNDNGLVVVSNAARIQRFTILPHDFSVETEELTATLKLKRSYVEKKYASAIDGVYAAADDSKTGMYVAL